MDTSSSYVQQCLDRLQQGDLKARNELLNHTSERLGQLAHLMLKGYPRLQRWEETGDVLQNALMRLWRAMEQLQPATVRDYYRVATLQIRRELLDLVRHHFGPRGPAAHHQTNPSDDRSSGRAGPVYEGGEVSTDPTRLAAWSEFHEEASALPEEEREVFDLVWYQGLDTSEVAALLDVSARTVKRRWQAACLRLHDALGGRLPGI